MQLALMTTRLKMKAALQSMVAKMNSHFLINNQLKRSMKVNAQKQMKKDQSKTLWEVDRRKFNIKRQECRFRFKKSRMSY